MIITNVDADKYLGVLQFIQDKVTGKSAYIVARNIRKLATELQDYSNVKDNTIIKYGVAKDDGNYVIQVGSEAHRKYIEEMMQYNEIEIDVDIMKVHPSDLFDSKLNASDILAIDFMLEEEDAESV